MANNRNERIRRLFSAALEVGRSEREMFLSEACAGDSSLKEEVASLLAAYEEAPGFLDKPESVIPVQSAAPNGAGSTEGEKEPRLPFERLGEFRLIRRLGEGGMGVVYLAVQESLNRQVALKVIRPGWMGSLEAEARFEREVKALAGLHNPNIVTVFQSGEEQGVHYFAMEYVPGQGLDGILREALSRGEKVSLQRILEWIREIAQALDSSHKNGIIHRDVKPSNIRIAPEGRAMLTDFSVARHSKLSTMTFPGEFRGTPYYASPEQVKARRREIDARTDVYSLGVTLFEAVTGRVPFEGETTEQVFRQILEKEPVPPRRLNPSISRDLDTVIVKAMEKDPSRRYQTMAEFVTELERLLAGEPVVARPAGRIRKSTKWVQRHRFSSLATLSAFLVLVAVMTVVLVVSKQRQEQLHIVMKRFKPVKEALEWPDFPTYANPWRWCLDAAPQDPSAYMLQAIIDIGSGALEEAAVNLKECIAKSSEYNEGSLGKDAHYLLGLVKLGLAEKYDDIPPKKKMLIEEAESELRRAGDIDPASPEALVLRSTDPFAISSKPILPDIRDIKLNTEHFLVQLYLGLSIFHDLYKGGEKGKFEKAIEHFENALETRSDNFLVLTFLGRTYYFFARFYNFLSLTDRAEDCLKRALEAAGDRPYHMIYTTLGQTWLLRGENDKALEAFDKALELERDKYHVHNAFRGIGKVLARRGMFEEAFEKYKEALEMERSDVHTNIAVAELLFLQGKIERTLEVLNEIQVFLSKTPKTHIASVYLVGALAHLSQEDYPEAIKDLDKMNRCAIHSPRDLSLACVLMATFPDEWRDTVVKQAVIFANKADYNARFEGKNSPLCCSALGAAAYLREEYQEAVECFRKAISERERWPLEVRAYHWTEDLRDQYFLAMAHFKLALENPGGKADERTALLLFGGAEDEYERKELPIESANIIKRVRAKAKDVMGMMD